MSKIAKGISITRLPLKNLVFTSLLINTVGIISIFLLKKNLPLEVPLFYGLPEGEEQLTTSLKLTIPFIYSLIITIINSLIAYFLQNTFLQKTLIATSLVVSVLALITVSKIIILVGSF